MEAYDVVFQVSQGLSLPKEETSYHVRLALNEFTMQTENEHSKEEGKESNYCRWSDRLTKTVKLPFSGEGDEQHTEHKFYIYLMEGDKPVCYYRGDMEDHMDINQSKLQWI